MIGAAFCPSVFAFILMTLTSPKDCVETTTTITLTILFQKTGRQLTLTILNRFCSRPVTCKLSHCQRYYSCSSDSCCIRIRTMQPVATCRQSPCVHQPAIAVTYLQFPIQVCFRCNDYVQPATPTSVTHRHLWVLANVNSYAVSRPSGVCLSVVRRL